MTVSRLMLFACLSAAALAGCRSHSDVRSPDSPGSQNSASANGDSGGFTADSGGSPNAAGESPATGAAPYFPGLPHEIPRTAADPESIIRLHFWRMIVPAGDISQNPEFWKLLDEDALDVSSYDRLYKNGLRVGRARINDWPMFVRFFEDHDAVCYQAMFAGFAGRGVVELEPDQPLMDEQTLFVFDKHGLSGRTYVNCRDELDYEFHWAPHKTRTVRLTLTPAVLTWRQHADYNFADDPADVVLKQPENLFELGLRVDVEPGEFLVVGPSPEVVDPNLVGSHFLMHTTPTKKLEELLIFVGAPLQQPAAPATEPSTPTATNGNVSDAH